MIPVASNFHVSAENPWLSKLNQMNQDMLTGAVVDAEAWRHIYQTAYAWEREEQGKQKVLKMLDENLKESKVNRQQPQTSTARIGRPAPPLSGDDARPKCTRHNTFMKYNPTEDRMECVKDGCKRVARKRRTFRDVLGAEAVESPVTYRGSLEFIIDESGELYLFLPDVNAAISLMSVNTMDLFDDDDAKDVALGFLSAVAKAAELATPAVARLKRRQRLTRETSEAVARQRMRMMSPTVNGGQQWRGISLPPHIRFDQIQNINECYQRTSFDKSLGEADRVSHAIELANPTVFQFSGSKNNAVDTNIYTVDGTLIHRVTYEYAMTSEAAKYKAALYELRAVAESVPIEDQPLYIMLDGLALTEAGCKKLQVEYSQRERRKSS
jgi:hypothetical protein